MWCVTAGEKNSSKCDVFYKNKFVAIGWQLDDLKNKTKKGIDLKYSEVYPTDSSETKGQAVSQINYFVNEIDIGDLIITSDNINKIYLIGKCISDYYFSNEKDENIEDQYNHCRDVEWKYTIDWDDIPQKIRNYFLPKSVYKINDFAKKYFLNIHESFINSMDNASNFIQNYLYEKNLGYNKNKDYENAYIKFKELFSPEILKNLQGNDILNKIFLHDEDKNNLCYYLEYHNDYKFAGSISGGSSYKFDLFKHSKTNQWTIGSPKKSKKIDEVEAVEIATEIRDAIVNGATLIENIELNKISDYIYLENELDKIFSNCVTSHSKQWIHKYYVLMFPDKFPNVHWDKMKKDLLLKFDISPRVGYYALDGQFKLLSSKVNIKLYALSKILNNLDGFSAQYNNLKRNKIYFGAPGTGKSYKLNKDKDKLLIDLKENYERVTFHPDYTYANFVGTYKPVPKDKSENDITYKFVPGPFMRILVNALKNPSEPFVLIIEEINRANVAAVFGDVFQLLDRNELNNNSQYLINASEDIKKYLTEESLKISEDKKIVINEYWKNILGEHFEKIVIPHNMFIWATMNSADQGVFPMDTAFKRRWDFEYLGINNGAEKIENMIIEVPESWNIKNNKLSWNDLRVEINKELLRNNINEDKLIGPFFAFKEYLEKKLEFNDFVKIFENKILMYLFEDAARPFRKKFFEKNDKESYLTYSMLCDKFRDEGVVIFNERIQKKFIKDIGE